MKKVIIQMLGGHTSIIKGYSVPEIEQQILDAAGHEFVYLRGAQESNNRLAVRRDAIVALVRVDE